MSHSNRPPSGSPPGTSPPRQQQQQRYPYNYLNHQNGNQQQYYNNNPNNYGNYHSQPYWNNYPPQQAGSFYPPHQYPNQNFQFNPNYPPAPYNNYPRQQFPNQSPTSRDQQQNNRNFSPNFNRNQNNYQNKRTSPTGFQNNNNNKAKKVKVDKRELPENNQFYCEVCDRGFKTDDKYKEHCATHTTCRVSGCKFTAAAKLVQIHYNNFHATGIDKKIGGSLESPEEVQKYINDRKKNFPTKSNLESRSKMDTDKVERGVVLETRQFGRFGKFNKRNQTSQHKEHKSDDLAAKENIGDKADLGQENKEESQKVGADLKRKPFEKVNKKRNKKKFKSQAQPISKKPTLLQKLLADEIRHERNILLQCVRFIVERNFFDKISPIAAVNPEHDQRPDTAVTVEAN